MSFRRDWRSPRRSRSPARSRSSSLASYALVRSELLQSIDESLRQRTESVSVFDERPFRFEVTAPRLGAAPGYVVVTAEGAIFHRDAEVTLPSQGAAAVAAGTRGPFFSDATLEEPTSGSSPTSSDGVAVQIARPSTRSTAHSTGSPRSWRRSRSAASCSPRCSGC